MRACRAFELLLIVCWLLFAGAGTTLAQPLAPQVQQPPQQPPAPFQLAPHESQELDRLLTAWEVHSAKVQTMTCTFQKWDYNPAFAPKPERDGTPRAGQRSTGEIRYANPDRGSYQEQQVFKWAPAPTAENPDAIVYRPSEEPGHHWLCDGKAIFEHRAETKQLVEHRLPRELQGKSISDGPLPFLFGVEAEKMKQRYWMRIITPANAQGEVWVEAYPKLQQDAANFSRVTAILRTSDLMPTALQLYRPGGASREVYVFDGHKVNSPLHKLQDVAGWFAVPRTPFGWKHIVEESGEARAAQGPTVPAGALR